MPMSGKGKQENDGALMIGNKKDSGEKANGGASSAMVTIGKYANHDFCPWANKYVYWIKQPIGWVVCGAFFSLLVGIFIGSQGYVLMSAFIALLILGAVWPWLSMKGVSSKLSFQVSRSEEKQKTVAILNVVNRWPVPIFGLMVEGKFLQDLVSEDDKFAIGLKRAPGFSVSRFEWELEPQRRGQIPTEQPKLVNGFPFGIYRAENQIEIEGETIVWPNTGELRGLPELNGLQFNIQGLASDRPGNDGDSIGVRAFRQGDSLRHIHWAKTACRNELIVRERQTCAQQPIEIVLDLSPANHSGVGSKSTYEWAIRIAAFIAKQLHRHHSIIYLKCIGLADSRPSMVTNQGGLRELLDFLAMLPELEIDAPAQDLVGSQHQAGMVAGSLVYLIGTTHSSFHSIQTDKSVRVVIDPVEFSHEPEAKTKTVSQGREKQIWISSPGSAAVEFEKAWEGVCGHGA